jgi:hypothetical protein
MLMKYQMLTLPSFVTGSRLSESVERAKRRVPPGVALVRSASIAAIGVPPTVTVIGFSAASWARAV